MENRNILTKVAEMYYRDKLTQQQIADKLEISRSMISRFLSQAVEMGIVEIIIHYADNRDRELEQRLCAVFGLKDARVAVLDEDASAESLYSGVHLLANEYLQERLQDGTILAVSWGRALACVQKAMRTRRRISTMKVVQAFGSAMPNQEQDGAALVGGIASHFGASAFYLYAPLHVANQELRDSLVNDENISSVIKLAEQADIILTGIGDTAPVPSGVAWIYYLKPEEEQDLSERGKVGHVCTQHFDINGNFLDSPACNGIIGLSRSSYMRIKLRVGVSYGEAKVEAMLGALRGDYVNVLISDDKTATAILDRLHT